MDVADFAYESAARWAEAAEANGVSIEVEAPASGTVPADPALLSRARAWWDLALGIQVWHHFEHALLLGQVLAGRTLFGAAVPTSVLQLFFPRVELHLAYNAAVLVPLCVSMYCHIFRPVRGLQPRIFSA